MGRLSARVAVAVMAAGLLAAAASASQYTSNPSTSTTGLLLHAGGPAEALLDAEERRVTLGNDLLAVSWLVHGSGAVHRGGGAGGAGSRTRVDHRLAGEAVLNKASGQETVLPPELFCVKTGRRRLCASAFDLVLPTAERPESQGGSGWHRGIAVGPTYTESEALEASTAGGRQVRVELRHAGVGLCAVWTAVLEDGANFVRTWVELEATAEDGVHVHELVLFDLENRGLGLRPSGSVRGDLVVGRGVFLGIEHPLADNGLGNTARAALESVSAQTLSVGVEQLLHRDVTALVLGDCVLDVYFDNWLSEDRIAIHGVALLRDGTVVSSDDHHGVASKSETRGNIFRLHPGHADPLSTYVLRFTLRTERLDFSQPLHVGLNRNCPARSARVRCAYWWDRRLHHGGEFTRSFVLGVAQPNQLRRAVLSYVTRARAHPAHMMLHWNSWYSIGTGQPYSSGDVLAVLRTLDAQLVQGRGVELTSILLDDGWDNTSSLWHFHSGFPDDLGPVADACTAMGMSPGIWLSPWGGYHGPKQRRIAAARQEGFESVGYGAGASFKFHGQQYLNRFSGICLDLIERFQVNLFKFDGIGQHGPGFVADMEAALGLMDRLRAAKHDVFINLSTGTWASPFFLRHVDAIWRGGHDHYFTGQGPARERWITYRDAMVFQNVVGKSPYYPLSALMFHGVIYAESAWDLNDHPTGRLGFQHEVRSAFGSGSMLQELYLTVRYLNSDNWDDIAEAWRWAKQHQDVFIDTHWVGGDPEAGAVYGWASGYLDGQATLTLRNPRESSQRVRIDGQAFFELPAGTAPFTMHAAFEGQTPARLQIGAGAGAADDVELTLEPFDVLVFSTAVRATGA